MEISLRKIKLEDFEFLWRLHNAALKDYVTQTWGWNEDWQQADFAAKFNPNDGEIITVDNVDAGFWWTSEKENEVVLISIRLLPEFQNRGIGSKLIGSLLEKTTKPVRLQVLKVNPARKFYERLNFAVVGETQTHFLMIGNG